MGAKREPPTPTKKQHIGLADLLPVVAFAALEAVPNPSGVYSDSASQELAWAVDSALGVDSAPAWNDPTAGGGLNLKLALEQTADNVLSLEGVVFIGGSLAVRHYVKHSTSLSRHAIFSSRHHKLTLGS